MGLIKTASSYEEDQRQMKAEADGIEASVATSRAPLLDAMTRANWERFYVQLIDLCTRPVVNWPLPWNPDNALLASSSLADTFASYQSQLASWKSKLAGLGVGGLPAGDANTINAGSQSLLTAVKYLSGAVVVGGVVYLVSTVRRVIP